MSKHALETLDKIEAPCIEVAVDSKSLPFKIGQVIDIGDGIPRTVVKVQVNEDGRAAYGLQWADGIEFKIDWFTCQKLALMHKMIKSKPSPTYLNG